MTDPQSTAYHGDCMDLMAQFPDNYFELAIVDPPYFKAVEKLGYFGARYSKTKVKRQQYKPKEWHIPTEQYFLELLRVSENQVIWGINYFNFNTGPGRIVWDKKNDASTFSDGEIASNSIIDTVRFFRFMWSGMLQGNMHKKESRIHPTQKPVALYEWILNNYAKEGDKILDTHMGSQSSRIASWKHGFDYWGSELDDNYFTTGCERFERESKQPMLLRI